MTQVTNTASTLEQLDALSIDEAQSLSFKERDGLLDLIIAEGRHLALVAEMVLLIDLRVVHQLLLRRERHRKHQENQRLKSGNESDSHGIFLCIRFGYGCCDHPGGQPRV